jgi:hypothetical protein
MKEVLQTAFLLIIVAFCLCAWMLERRFVVFRELELALIQAPWLLLICLVVWCGTFLFLTFSLKDLPLIGLLVIAIVAFFISLAESRPATDATTLLFGVTLGKGMRFMLHGGSQKSEIKNMFKIWSAERTRRNFLIGLVVLLAFGAWWHSNITGGYYNGPRWMGLWDNPNEYGMLMGAGITLTIGLLAQNLKSEKLKVEMEKRTETGNLKPEAYQKVEPAFTLLRRGKSGRQKLLIGFLLVAAFMMGTGLIFSFSRGA